VVAYLIIYGDAGVTSYFSRVADAPSRQTPVNFFQPTGSTAVQPLHRR